MLDDKRPHPGIRTWKVNRNRGRLEESENIGKPVQNLKRQIASDPYTARYAVVRAENLKHRIASVKQRLGYQMWLEH